MKGKLFDLVRGGLGGFCISIMFLLTAVLAVHGTVSGSETVIATVSVGDQPFGVGVNSETNRIYVANYNSNTVSVIDGTSNQVVATVGIGNGPEEVGVNPQTNRIYVTNVYSGTVNVIDGATNQVVGTVTVGSPIGVGVNPQTNRIYAANYASNTVSVIDGSSNVIATVTVGTTPLGVGVNSKTNRIYVVNYTTSTVSVIDGASNNVVAEVGVGSNPYFLGVNSQTNRIYVANYTTGTVSVIDGTSNQVIATITVGSEPMGVGVNPQTNRIYVANKASSTVSVIDGATNQVVSTVEVEAGTLPRGVAVNPTTNRIYVSNWGGDVVSVIDAQLSPQGVTTSAATNVTSSSAILNGTVNANGLSTTAWFNYGITSGSYPGTSTTQPVSGSSDTSVSIGINGLSSSTTYYYRIAAQNSAGTSYGSETSFATPAPPDIIPPTVSSTSPASNAIDVGISSAISATFSEDMDSSTINTNTFTLSGGGSVSGTVSYSNKVATFTPSSNLSYSTTYTAAITTGVKDSAGNPMLSNYSWSFKTASSPDTIPPSGLVSINSGASYTNSTSVTFSLSATDNVGVVGYYASTSPSTPTASASGWNSVTSTTLYTGSVSYTLASGDEQKTVYVWFKDAAGNVSSTANDNIVLDTTAPIVTINSPTSSDTYTTTSNPLSLSGSASDISSRVKEVTWSNSRGGSGAASETTSWSVSSISLSSGNNIINVTATDNAGNTGKDTITVTYTVQPSTPTTTPKPSPIQIPTPTTILTGSININGGATYTNATTVTLNLSASNITGVTGYYLSTSFTKPSSGDTGWVSISSTTSYSADVSYSLSIGDGNQTVYVWYKDTAGNISDAANDSIILDTTAPTITITSPTSDATYTTTRSTISLGGSASDSTSGLNSVTWSNNRGESGTASGTIGWSISNIDLAGGDNTITVTATDGAGNTGTDTITVTYETSITTPTPTLINCTAESIVVSQDKFKLKRNESYDVAIAVSGEDDCPVEGEIVTATINAAGKRRISISPSTQATDENGEVVFTITAKNKIGFARVTFSAGGFKKSITVKVKR